ncbi:MAG: efflux RND transporter periplasmic adaptor subunit [Thermoanaerobaculia bacterium]
MKKKIVWFTIVALLGAAAFLAFRSRGNGAPRYRTAKVDRGDVTQVVTATGVLSAVTTVKVGSQVSGIIAALHADFNKEVKKGSLLAELDPTPFQARVAQSQATLDKAKVEVRNAEISLRRQSTLKQQGLSPQADFDQAQANFDSARAAVAQAEAGLSQARTDLNNSRIHAPIDGVVVDRQYDVGQTVAASFQAPTLFTIAQDLTKMQVSADVSESDIGGVRVGQPVRFSVDAFADRVFRGAISQIRLNATVNQNVVTYPVIIGVPNPDLNLRPSMTANVSIDVATAQGSLRIPNAALRWKPENAPAAAAPAEERAARAGGEKGSGAMARQFGSTGGPGGGSGRPRRGQAVYVLPASGQGEPKPVEVRAGISDGRFTQIMDGPLKESDTVVIGLSTARADVAGAPVGSRGPGGPGVPGGGPRRGF